MRIAVEVRHPAHVHHFRLFIEQLRDHGHSVMILAVKKDITTDLLDNFGLRYELIGEKRAGLLRTALQMTAQITRFVRHCRRFRPDILVGRPSPTVNIAGALLRIPTIIFAEDDLAVAPLAGVTAYPFARVVLAPLETRLGRWETKKVAYPGYQKLAYLHPARFSPDRSIVDAVTGPGQRFFLMRLALLKAHHDADVGGMDDGVLARVVELLASHGRVLISSERPLPALFEPYRVRIDPTHIHHFLAFADAFVGDSQSMTVEAAMLGTPSIRYSSLVGRISVLESLEHRYRLTTGVHTSQPVRLIDEIQKVLDSTRAEWTERRARMLHEKIDVTAFMTWFVETWPQSEVECRADARLFDRFRDVQQEAPVMLDSMSRST